ncbi:hypothetical protein ACFP2T_37530 [Plantactinospora solaniradicis]|uniref:WXG100 family type VII secretion target n=1 Tax=Plantactinospora solaniradicis TaxID=1723736 RepID=A0ABW1KJ90_9ACTN
MNGTLSVETAALVRHASGRYSDAMACDAIGHYVRHVGAVPDNAWGPMDWVQKWRTEWAGACDERVKEAGLASERFGDVGETLYQVAANYADTDIKVASDFSTLQGTPLMPFIDGVKQPPGRVARPGGHLDAPARYTGGTYALNIPDGVPDAHDLNLLWKDGSIVSEAALPQGADLSKTPQGLLQAEFLTEGHRMLKRFISQWGNELATAEAIVRQWGLAPAESSLELIDQANSTWPGVIRNRANLLKHGANAYQALRDNLSSQIKDLQQYWSSPGAAGSYVVYAGSLGNYYGSVSDNLRWLGDEGVKAAVTLDRLQLAFANLGFEHIKIISAQLQAYNEVAGSLSKSVDKPLEALANAVTALTKSLITSWESAAQKAQTTLSVTEIVIDRAPQFSDNNHALKQPPASPSNEWRGNGWRPGSRVPTA